jgi:fused signal recognition particle receptor
MVFNIFRKSKPKPEVKPVPEVKQETAPETKQEPALEAKPEAVLEAKPEIISEVESEVKSAQPDPKPEQADPKTEQAEETKPENSTQVQSKGAFAKLKSGLAKTRKVLNTDINELFGSAKAIDEELFEELEELLITSDFGIDVTMEMMDRIRKKAKKLSNAVELKKVLKEELIGLFPISSNQMDSDSGVKKQETKPRVIMVVGVNGTGKTTTLGKLAMKFTSKGQKVLIAAADTFRAAAIEQVEIWATRSNATIVKHKEGSDPAAVAYDAIAASIARDIDVVLVDTAGRLHTQKNLMEELKKIKRSIDKKLPGAPHEVLMVLDATTGQNAVSQAKLFNEAVGLTQIALTKLDGTAKGGIVASIASTMNLPIKYIGVGEQIQDLQDFDSKTFINALFD